MVRLEKNKQTKIVSEEISYTPLRKVFMNINGVICRFALVLYILSALEYTKINGEYDDI